MVGVQSRTMFGPSRAPEGKATMHAWDYKPYDRADGRHWDNVKGRDPCVSGLYVGQKLPLADGIDQAYGAQDIEAAADDRFVDGGFRRPARRTQPLDGVFAAQTVAVRDLVGGRRGPGKPGRFLHDDAERRGDSAAMLLERRRRCAHREGRPGCAELADAPEAAGIDERLRHEFFPQEDFGRPLLERLYRTIEAPDRDEPELADGPAPAARVRKGHQMRAGPVAADGVPRAAQVLDAAQLRRRRHVYAPDQG